MSRPTSVPPAPVRGPGPGAPRPVPAPRAGVPLPGTVRRVTTSLLVALVAAVGVWVTWRAFVGTERGQAVDQASLDGAHIGQGRLWQVAEPVLDVVSVGFIAGAVLTCAVIAVARRRWALALVAGGVLAGANITTRVLKTVLLDRPDLGYGPDFNTLPSGHTTAAASVAAAVLLVVPPRARPWAAVLGGAYAGATGVSTLVGQWHRPSDVVAGLLVVLVWGALGCAVLALRAGSTAAWRTWGGDARPATGALRSVTDRGERTGARAALVLLAAVAALTGGAAVVALRRTWLSDDPVGSTAALLTSYGGGALGIVAVAAVVSGTLLVLRRSATSGSVPAGPRS